MIFKGEKIFNASFDTFASDYDEVRPGYPEQMFEDIGQECDLNPQTKLLEIGAGSGIATLKLANFGSQIIALEPGEHLAEIAKKRTKEFKNVTVTQDTFENFQSHDRFDIISAFTAFHWIKGADKLENVIRFLKDSGSLVLVWNSFFQDNSAITAKINEAYRQLLPDIYGNNPDATEINRGVLAKLAKREHEISHCDLVYTVFLRRYLTRYVYNKDTYPKLLNTFPKVVAVQDDRRQNFLAQISQIVESYEEIIQPVLTTLIISRKKEHLLQMVSKE